MDTIDRIQSSFQHGLEVEGILLTMYDDRTNLTRQVANDLTEFFGDKVFKTIIPRSIRLAEAPSFGKTILTYDPRSRGAESYIKLAKEILDHEQTRRIRAKLSWISALPCRPGLKPTPRASGTCADRRSANAACGLDRPEPIAATPALSQRAAS